MKPTLMYIPQNDVKVIQFEGVSSNFYKLSTAPSDYYSGYANKDKRIKFNEISEKEARKKAFEISENLTVIKEAELLNIAKSELVSLLNMNNEKDITIKINEIDQSLSLQTINSDINQIKNGGKSGLIPT